MNYLKIHGLIEYNKDVATAVGVTEATISRAVKRGISADLAMSFNATYGNIFNIDWLLHGNGEMLAKEKSTNNVNNSNVINGNNNSNISQTINTSSEDVEEAEVVEDFETAPVIPSVWAKRTNFDIVEAIEERSGELEKSRVAVAGTQIDAWHIITDNSMFPYFYKGDKVALAIAPTKKIMPGCMYGLDTIPHGLIVRTLFETENGYRAHAYNSDEYPDFILAEEDVQNILRVICSFRI